MDEHFCRRFSLAEGNEQSHYASPALNSIYEHFTLTISLIKVTMNLELESEGDN
jgi:hypothetical protein